MGCHTPESEKWALWRERAPQVTRSIKGTFLLACTFWWGFPLTCNPWRTPCAWSPGNSLGPGASIPLSAVKWLWRAGLGLGWKSYSTFSGGWDGKEFACNAGDLGSIPGSGRSPGEGNDNPLQYSCLENFTDSPWGHTESGMTEWLVLALPLQWPCCLPGDLALYEIPPVCSGHVTGKPPPHSFCVTLFLRTVSSPLLPPVPEKCSSFYKGPPLGSLVHSSLNRCCSIGCNMQTGGLVWLLLC